MDTKTRTGKKGNREDMASCRWKEHRVRTRPFDRRECCLRIANAIFRSEFMDPWDSGEG